MARASTNRGSKDSAEWDAVDVWHRLLRSHPVRAEDPATCTGRIEHRFLRDFCLAVADLPDPIQDTLFVLAHARGRAYAIGGLDSALRAQLATRPAVSGSAARPARLRERAWHGRKAS